MAPPTLSQLRASIPEQPISESRFPFFKNRLEEGLALQSQRLGSLGRYPIGGGQSHDAGGLHDAEMHRIEAAEGSLALRVLGFQT